MDGIVARKSLVQLGEFEDYSHNDLDLGDGWPLVTPFIV